MARNRTLDAIAASPANPDEMPPDWARGGQGDSPEPETAEVLDGPASKTPALNALMEWMNAMAGETDAGDRSAIESIVREALAAQDATEVLRRKLPVSASDFLEIPMLLTGFRVVPSDFDDNDEGCPFYASLRVEIGDPPEPKVINLGGWGAMAQIAALDGFGEWPKVVQIITVGKPKKGRKPSMRLVEVEA